MGVGRAAPLAVAVAAAVGVVALAGAPPAVGYGPSAVASQAVARQAVALAVAPGAVAPQAVAGGGPRAAAGPPGARLVGLPALGVPAAPTTAPTAAAAPAVAVTEEAMVAALRRDGDGCVPQVWTGHPFLWDFTGDGVRDGMVGWSCTGGSSGVSGVAVFAGAPGGPVRLPDLPVADDAALDGVEGVFLLRGQVVVQYAHLGPDDPLCCASAERVVVYAWSRGAWAVQDSWTTPYDGDQPDADRPLRAVLVLPAAADLGGTYAFDLLVRNGGDRRWTGRVGIGSTGVFPTGVDGSAGPPFRAVRDATGAAWRHTDVPVDVDEYHQWTRALSLAPGEQATLPVTAEVVARIDGFLVGDVGLMPVAGTGQDAPVLAAMRWVAVG